MRQTISGLVAAIAVMTAGAAPAMACGGGLGSCSPCGVEYVSPCGPIDVPAATYSGCNIGCGGWAYERLPDPELQYHSAPVRYQYYYVNQGPTYTGSGAFAPYPTYQESGWGAYRYGPVVYRYRAHRHYGYRGHTLRRYY